MPYSKVDGFAWFWYGFKTSIRYVPSFVDRTGYQYGRWLVNGLDNNKSTKKRKYWVCECSCGTTKSVLGDNLTSGKSTSCGCYSAERNEIRAKTRTKWGPELAPTRHVWRLMWRRCTNPKDNVYKHYGARGIKVCPEWESFDKFLSDMGTKPEGFTLERTDVNGNYCPENCCWATMKEQARNRRNTKWFTINNQKKSAAEWCEIYNCKISIFYERTARGWDPLKALTTPPRRIDQAWRKKVF